MLMQTLHRVKQRDANGQRPIRREAAPREITLQQIK
jgi:hypothetical protein